MKLLYGALVLAYTPLVIAGNDAAYPTEKLAAFVVDKVDVTTLPSAIRPKSVKGKRRSAITDMWRASSIEVLEAKKSGIYVCMNSQSQNESGSRFQRVFLLKLKNANALLKGRETWKEFDSCPGIGGGDQDSTNAGY